MQNVFDCCCANFISRWTLALPLSHFVSWIFSWNARPSPLWLFRHDDGWLWYENCVWKCRTGAHAPCTTHTHNTRTLTSQSTDANHDFLFSFDFIRDKKLVWCPFYVSVSCEPAVPERQKCYHIFSLLKTLLRLIPLNPTFLVLQKKLWPRSGRHAAIIWLGNELNHQQLADTVLTGKKTQSSKT